MTQKVTDFIKFRGSKLVLAQNDDYYLEIKKMRAHDAQMAQINNRLEFLEQQVNLIKDLLRGRLVNHTNSSST